MDINLDSTLNVTVQAAQTASVGTLSVDRFVDVPSLSAVYAFVNGFGRIKLTDISDNNYDKPEWTNETATAALKSVFTTAATNNTAIPLS